MGKRAAASGLAAILGLIGFVFILVAICTNFWLVSCKYWRTFRLRW